MVEGGSYANCRSLIVLRLDRDKVTDGEFLDMTSHSKSMDRSCRFVTAYIPLPRCPSGWDGSPQCGRPGVQISAEA